MRTATDCFAKALDAFLACFWVWFRTCQSSVLCIVVCFLDMCYRLACLNGISRRQTAIIGQFVMLTYIAHICLDGETIMYDILLDTSTAQV